MSTLVWPSELPQSFPLDSEEKPLDQRARWQPDAGPSKSRAIWTAEPVDLTPPPFLFSGAQYDLFRAFYDQTLDRGTEQFDWLNPWPGAGVVRLEIASYAARRITSRVNVTPEMLPAGSSNPQQLVRVALAFSWQPWAPYEFSATGTLTLAARVTTSGVDLAGTAIAAGDFVYFAADGRGKAAAVVGVTIPSILNLVASYPVGPVGRSGAIKIVKVKRS